MVAFDVDGAHAETATEVAMAYLIGILVVEHGLESLSRGQRLSSGAGRGLRPKECPRQPTHVADGVTTVTLSSAVALTVIVLHVPQSQLSRAPHPSLRSVCFVTAPAPPPAGGRPAPPPPGRPRSGPPDDHVAVKPAGPEAGLSSALSPTCFKPLISGASPPTRR